MKAGKVNLDDPATTLALLKLNSVVGVKGVFDKKGALVSIGITCAFCHSTVDDAFIPGIGHRLDGWPNRDLNVGVIASLAPNLDPVAKRLHTDVATVKKVFASWGPGKYDAEILEDGKAFRPDGKSAATLLPPAFGLAGVNLHTYGGWGSVTHWNAYVANTQMHGKGTFYDPRMNDPAKFPIAVENKDWNMRSTPDLVTAKLAALHFYQLAIPAPMPPAGSFDKSAAARGEAIFKGKADCARCHVPPLFTEPGWNMHKPAEIGIDDFQAMRSPDGMYRTTPLKGLWSHQKGGFYPRRKIRHPPRCRKSLQHVFGPETERSRQDGHGRVPQVALARGSLYPIHLPCLAERVYGFFRSHGRAPFWSCCSVRLPLAARYNKLLD